MSFLWSKKEAEEADVRVADEEKQMEMVEEGQPTEEREYTEEELAPPHKATVMEALSEVVKGKEPVDPEVEKERHRHRFDSKAGVVLAAHKT